VGQRVDLPPTKANLSMLHQRIPAGFKHV